MKKVLFSTCLVAVSRAWLCSIAACVATLPLLFTTIRGMLASVDKFILEEGYGCNVDTVPGDIKS